VDIGFYWESGIEHTGRRRREPVWIGRYRIVGKDSAKVLGRAWTKRSQAPDGYLTRSQAEAALRQLLAAEGAAVKAAHGASFDEVAEIYVTSLRGRIKSGSFRSSTLRTYENIIAKELSPPWCRRKITSVTRDEVAAYRTQLAARDLAEARSIRHGRSSAACSPPPLSASTSRMIPRSPSSAPRRAGRPRTRSASIPPTRRYGSSITPATTRMRRCGRVMAKGFIGAMARGSRERELGGDLAPR
jgi:hypothetical protein